MSGEPILRLFEGVGIELEYMIVDRDGLNVLPAADRVLAAEAGRITSDVEFPDVSWSNELVLHLIEFKTSGPARGFDGLTSAFNRHVARVNEILSPLGARLMPTAMHPWMDPFAETRLWPHEYNLIYETFHRIFDCRGHGWSNVQSLHVNLPFANDEEFGRLHAALRLLLPIIPGLAAASPVVAAKVNGILDNRLEAYRHQCDRIPSVMGRLIPEPVFSSDEYRERILRRLYRDVAPHDPEGIVQYEWSNARGAIARFERNTIEIRVIDVQECPAADLAVAAAIVTVAKMLVEEEWTNYDSQQEWPVDVLADMMESTIRDGESTSLDNPDYLRLFGWPAEKPCRVGELWRHLVEQAATYDPDTLRLFGNELDIILEEGTLARRILGRLDPLAGRDRIEALYRHLCDCLADGKMLRRSNE